MLKLDKSGWELPEELGLILDKDFDLDSGDDLKSADGRFLVTIDIPANTDKGYYVKIYHDDMDDFDTTVKDLGDFINMLARIKYKPALYSHTFLVQ